MNNHLKSFEEYIVMLASMKDLPPRSIDLLAVMTAELVLASQTDQTIVLHAQQLVGGK